MSKLHPQVQALVDAQAAGANGDGPPDLMALRAGYLQTALELGGAIEEVAGTEDVVFPREDGGSVAARVYLPRHPEPKGVMVWFHGGGWCMGDIEGFDRVARALTNASGATVVSVDYRLAPEAPFPAAIEDADAALRWARGDGAVQLDVDPEDVVVGGDSAGGQLAAVAARHARSDGLPELRAQVLVYPALDPTRDSEAYRSFREGPMLTDSEMELCWTTYLGENDPSHPDVAPLHATDHEGVAPAIIGVAEVDPLRDDGLAYARTLRDAGVPVTLQTFAGMAHGFLRWGGVVDGGRELIAWIGNQTRDALDDF